MLESTYILSVYDNIMYQHVQHQKMKKRLTKNNQINSNHRKETKLHKTIHRTNINNNIYMKLTNQNESIDPPNRGLAPLIDTNLSLDHRYVQNNDTINFAIKMFICNNVIQSFDIVACKKYISNLMDNGIGIDNEKENTLSLILKLATKYILSPYNSKKTIKNVLIILHFLINQGSTEGNPLSGGARPENDNAMSRYNTLTLAVRTNNLDIVKTIYQCGAEPDNRCTEENTLSQAVLVGNVKIMKYVIMSGATPDNNSYYNTFNKLNYCYNNKIHCNDTINKMFYILMCVGAQVSRVMVDSMLCHRKRTKFENKTLHCCAILFLSRQLHESFDDTDSGRNRDIRHTMIEYYSKPATASLTKKIKNELQNTMDQLVAVVTTDRYNEIKKSTHIYECLTKIIYEYQYSIPFAIIDWKKM